MGHIIFLALKNGTRKILILRSVAFFLIGIKSSSGSFLFQAHFWSIQIQSIHSYSIADDLSMAFFLVAGGRGLIEIYYLSKAAFSLMLVSLF